MCVIWSVRGVTVWVGGVCLCVCYLVSEGVTVWVGGMCLCVCYLVSEGCDCVGGYRWVRVCVHTICTLAYST